MKKKLLLLAPLLCIALQAQGARVAVVDSGVDFEHENLKNNAWVNTAETPSNRVDDDQNGKVDDINGWNFIDGYGRVFFREHLTDVNPLAYKVLQIIARQQAGTVSEEENNFFKDNVSALPDAEKKALYAHLNFFGQYLHGTHVAGIVQSQHPDSKILASRVFPDDPPPVYAPLAQADDGDAKPRGFKDWLYRLLAMASNGSFHVIGEYLEQTEMDVANYSLGMSLSMVAENILRIGGNQNPTEEEIAAEARRMYKQFEPEGEKWVSSAPQTLFVVAAGNEANDNDTLPAFPANIQADNLISVAATLGYSKLADFSNYGATMVDIAAPGVAIESPVPSLDNKTLLPLSGTSMASPFVAGVAARVKDANPELSPGEIKEILMGTVDQKDWLVGKVVSAGVVNADRAAHAGHLSKEMGLSAAIAAAKGDVADRAEGDHQPKSLKLFQASPELKAAAEKFVF